MIARRKGYRVAVVMPDNVTQERRQLLAPVRRRDHRLARRSWAPTAPSRWPSDLVAEDPRFVMPYQYGNPANPRAHEETTAEEIIADCPEVDVFVAGLGTGGTLMGVGRRLRRHNPDVRIYAAEPLPGEARPGPALARRGLHPRDLRPDRARREVPGLQRGVDPRAARPDRARGHLRGRLVGRRARGGRARGRDHGARHDRGAARGRRLEVPLGGLWTRDLDGDGDEIESLNLW